MPLGHLAQVLLFVKRSIPLLHGSAMAVLAISNMSIAYLLPSLTVLVAFFVCLLSAFIRSYCFSLVYTSGHLKLS